jgi:hypothetical protein
MVSYMHVGGWPSLQLDARASCSALDIVLRSSIVESQKVQDRALESHKFQVILIRALKPVRALTSLEKRREISLYTLLDTMADYPIPSYQASCPS